MTNTLCTPSRQRLAPNGRLQIAGVEQAEGGDGPGTKQPSLEEEVLVEAAANSREVVRHKVERLRGESPIHEN